MTIAPAEHRSRSVRRSGIGTNVWWRQLRADKWADVAIAVVIAVTCFVVASAPRVFERAAQDDLSEAVQSATPEQRNLLFESRDVIGAGPPRDPFLNVEILGQRLIDEYVPETVADLITDEHWVVDSPSFVVSSFPDRVAGPFPSTFRFRYQDGIEQHSTLVAGRAPTLHDPLKRLEGTECPVDVTVEAFEYDVDVDCAIVVLPVFETALTQQTADDLQVTVGDRVSLAPSPTDVLFRTNAIPPNSAGFVLDITGIIELDEVDDEYWYADSSLHRPRITENPDFRLVFAVGLLSPDQFRRLNNAHGAPSLFSWRFLVDGNRVQAGNAEELRDEVAKISAPDIDLITLLPEILGEHLDQRRLALALLSLAAFGIAVAALASIWVLTAVDGTRRASVTSLIIDRGASRRQMATHSLRTALIVAVPAATVAAAVALTLLPEPPAGPSIRALVVVVVAAAGFVVALGAPTHRVVDSSQRRMRRLMVEIGALVVTVGVVVLLRRRDRAVDDVSDSGFDMLLAAAPALIALVAAIVMLRLIGPLAELLSFFTARGRAAGWFVGVRRLVTQSAAVRAPTGAIALAAAIAVFAAVVSTSLTHSRELASWQAIGAEARIETGNPDVPLSSGLQTDIAEQAETVAFGASLRFQRFDGDTGSFVADVVAIDLDRLDVIIPAGLRHELLEGDLVLVHDDSEQLPALLVGFGAAATPSVGDVARLLNGPYSIPTVMQRSSDRFPGIRVGRPTIIVDRQALRTFTDDRTVEPTFALLGERFDADELDASVTDPAVLARWTTRAEEFADVSGDPLSRWTTRSVWALGLAGTLLAVVTASAAAVITAAARRRDLGVMSILGLERAAAARLIAIELIPGIMLAAVGGAAAGTIGARVLGDNLSLAAFAGGGEAAGIRIDWFAVAAVLAVIAVAATAAVLLTMRSVRRVDHGMLLRKGDL